MGFWPKVLILKVLCQKGTGTGAIMHQGSSTKKLFAKGLDSNFSINTKHK